jgi:predicted nucleic acid-binding protein
MIRELIYWDSAAFLAYFQNEPASAELCQSTLERAEAGDILIITSTLTIAECLWLKGSPKLSKDRAEIIRRFFRRSCISLRNVTRATSELAQDLVWDQGLKPKDAIHAATAIETSSPIIETFDHGFIKRSACFGNPAIIVRNPLPPREPRLL